jgi:MFS family permease
MESLHVTGPAHVSHSLEEEILTPSQRRRSLVIAFSCAVAFGAGVGLVWPLRALILEGRGVDVSVNGLSSGAAFLGVIVGPLLSPLFVRRIGLVPFLLTCLALHTVLLLSLKIFGSITVWFFLCVGMGVAGSGFFTAAEAWITTTARDEQRGRVIALYSAALSVGFMIGPLLLSLTGLSGWAPFLSGAAINGLAALTLFFARDLRPRLGIGARLSAAAIFIQVPVIVVAVALFGFYEATVVTVFPIWGVRVGLDPRASAALVSALYCGTIVLQWPIGVFSDRASRLTILRLCSGAGAVGAFLLPFVATRSLPLFAAMALWGGFASALYPVALSVAGDRFRGTQMMTVTAVLLMGYGIGSSLGPTLGGIALDLWSPHGPPAEFAVLFALFFAITFVPKIAQSVALPPSKRGRLG